MERTVTAQPRTAPHRDRRLIAADCGNAVKCEGSYTPYGLMFVSSVGKPVNLDSLAADVIVPRVTKAGIQWHGWHAFRRGLATNLHQLGVSDKIIQRILRHANVAVTQNCCIKTVDSEVAAAMQKLERSLENAPNMHLSGIERKHLMRPTEENA